MKSTLPSPITEIFPRCETSKMPTCWRTAVYSAIAPVCGYSIGISQPPKSAIFALRAKCLSASGDWFMTQTYTPYLWKSLIGNTHNYHLL